MSLKYADLSDESLVMLTLAGEQTAYEALVVRYQKAVISAAASVTRNAFMAEVGKVYSQKFPFPFGCQGGRIPAFLVEVFQGIKEYDVFGLRFGIVAQADLVAVPVTGIYYR